MDTFRPKDPTRIPFGQHRGYRLAWYHIAAERSVPHAEGEEILLNYWLRPWIEVFATDDIPRLFFEAWSLVKEKKGEIEVPPMLQSVSEKMEPGESMIWIRPAYVVWLSVSLIEKGIADL